MLLRAWFKFQFKTLHKVETYLLQEIMTDKLSKRNMIKVCLNDAGFVAENWFVLIASL